MMLLQETILALVDEIVRLGKERDEARETRDRLHAEAYPLRARVAELEAKYEPKPVIIQRIVYTDKDGNEVWQDGSPKTSSDH